MEIRTLRREDAPELLPLVCGIAKFHDETATATVDTLARDLAEGWLWGVGVGSPLVGYGLLMPYAQAQFGIRGADLHHLFVAESARRQGLARRLIAACEVAAQDRGCHFLVIGAAAWNKAAHAAYETADYVRKDWSGPRFRKDF